MTWQIRKFSSCHEAQEWLDELEMQGWSIHDVRISADLDSIYVAVSLYSPPAKLPATVDVARMIDMHWGDTE
jgi:hypothetical protein